MKTFTPSADFLLSHPCLSIRQPKAHCIFHEGKDVENRTRKTPYRGPLIIHAGLAYLSRAEQKERGLSAEDMAWFDQLDFGAAIGVVDVVDCVSKSKSKWFNGPHALVLAKPRLFPKPIPLKGRLGMFRLRKSDLPRVKTRPRQK